MSGFVKVGDAGIGIDRAELVDPVLPWPRSLDTSVTACMAMLAIIWRTGPPSNRVLQSASIGVAEKVCFSAALSQDNEQELSLGPERVTVHATSRPRYSTIWPFVQIRGWV